MAGLYPEIEPHRCGRLDVGDGNLLYWEECGNPDGKPAVVLHGGPGSGCSPAARRYYDPAAYRVVLFDQRNCGRSTPSAGDPATDLSANTTDRLIGDLERLREHLGIERWQVRGGSWGAVLALAYAQRYPGQVSELLLLGVATGRRLETDLLTRGLGGLFPEAHARFLAALPAADRDGDPAVGYARLLADPDPAVHGKAAADWCDWEAAIVPNAPRHDGFDDPEFRLTFARLVTHYWSHGSFLDDGILLREAGKLAGIPGTIIQGTLDLGNLLGTAWELAHAWPGCRLVSIPDAGHNTTATLASAVVAATDAWSTRP